MAQHPGSVDRHGTRWRVRMRVAGELHTWNLDGDHDRGYVERFARDKGEALRRRHAKGLPRPMRFSALLARYREAGMPGKLKRLAPLTKTSYEVSLQAYETYFVIKGGDPKMHDITRGHVNGFLDWRAMHQPDGRRVALPCSARTVAKDRAVLHRLFQYAMGLEICESNPVALTDAPKGDGREPTILDVAEYEGLLAACEGRPMLSLYVMVLGETGVRSDSEALWIRWSDVDFETGFLNIESVKKGRRTKSGRSRRVPMTPRLRDAMRDHFALYRFATYHGERTPWVFHHELDRRHAKAGTRLGGLRRAFAGAVKRAGLPDELRQHDLRHRRVTVWLAEGKPMALVQRAMGHSSIRVTEGYLHLVDDDLKALVESPGDEELRALAEG